MKYNLINELLERKTYLEKWIRNYNAEIKQLPEGELRVSYSHNVPQYFRKVKSKPNGIYIRKKDIQYAKGLAQREYNRNALEAMKKEVDYIEKLVEFEDKESVEGLYAKLDRARKNVVNPISESSEEFTRKWKSISYEGKGFEEDSPEYYSNGGVRVRSKSEKIIADKLEYYGVLYRYEYPFRFRDGFVVYPDFTVLNIKSRKEYIWEHFGIMDNADYANKAVKKISRYEKEGLIQGDKLLMTFETGEQPLNTLLIDNIIKKYLI